MTRRRLLLPIAAVLLAASCGGAGSAADDSTRHGTTTRTSPTTPGVGDTDRGTVDPGSAPGDGPVDACGADELPLEERARTMVFAEIMSDAPEQAAEAVRAGVGGVFIGGDAVGVLTAPVFRDALAAVSPPPLVAIDEEGGTVQRLGRAGIIPPTPSARTMGDTMTIEEIRAQGAATGAELRALGVTMDFAPVADVGRADGPMGSRTFSAEPTVVAEAATAFAEGLAEAGVIPTLKHFPGHGRASGDTHTEAVRTPSRTALDAVDLVPFIEGIRRVPTAAVMVGHLVVPDVSDGQPASLSREVVAGLLRGELGFDGLIVTDDLGAMRAITDQWTPAEAGVRAAGAGIDMALVPAGDTEAVVGGIVEAVVAGDMHERSLTASAGRVLAARSGDAGCS